MKIKIFNAEIEAGLASLIKNNNSISYCTKVEKFTSSNIDVAALASLTTAFGTTFNTDLYYPTKSILATTSWNLNDDVFGPQETWGARHTPLHSPTNIDHNHRKIVGHIASAWAIDADGNLIDDNIDIKDLPDKFHLCDGALIYKYNREEDLQEQVVKLIEQIENKEKFVSMECLFPGFDYAVISPENKYYIIERNESTAFLTKHLRIYGGKGNYEGNKIGRFLKNMVFSGKGYVDVPANPESIIFDSDADFNFSAASFQDKWFVVKDKSIIVPEMSFTESNSMENDLMSEELNKQIDELKAQNASLEKQLSEINAKAMHEEIATLKAQLAEVQSEAEAKKKSEDEAKKKMEEKEKGMAELTAKVDELTSANTELTNKIQEAEANKIRNNRISTLVDGGLDKTEAEAKVTMFANLNDEQFAAYAADVIKSVNKSEVTTETTAEVNEETLANVKTDETSAGLVVPNTEEGEVEAKKEALRLSLAKRFGYVQPENNNGEE